MLKPTQHQWTLEELQALYDLPFMELISKAHGIHIGHHSIGEIQVCTLISIKTGGCPENCRYCSQSSHYKTNISPQALMSYKNVLLEAQKAKKRGVTRICLGAAWREVRESPQFDEVLRMVSGIRELGLEVCCTLGMLKSQHAQKLKKAGLYAYNHNLDTSEDYYTSVVTTRNYQDRLETLKTVQEAGLSICCGGILGIGEGLIDRLKLLQALANRSPQPESVPINRLEAVAGTPFADQPKCSSWELIRIIAIARILMPQAMVRLSAGRKDLSFAEQALCFFAGANSIHSGEKLLTVSNPSVDHDEELFRLLGLKKRSDSPLRGEYPC